MIGNRITIAAATLLLLLVQGSAGAVDVVVVCPEKFDNSMGPWLEHRRGEGLEVCVIRSSGDAESLRSAIAEASGDQTRYVLLVGDAPVVGRPCNATRQTPILYSPSKVTAHWGSTPTFSSDMLFGDFDRDRIPEAVVGRLPVDEPEQLTRMITRIIARDTSNDFGPWRSKVQLVGGVGGFGAMADGAIESVTRTIVTGVLPPETKTTVCYASPGHRFFPASKSFTDAVLDRYQQGSRFWVYAGHGQVTHLDRVPRSINGTPVLDDRSVHRLSRPAGCSPIAVMLACYTGAMDAPEDSIAEEMVLSEGGPIAVLAGSRVTMPYGNTTAAVGLIDGIFKQKLPRLGDAWLSALSEMNREVSEDTSGTRMMIDALATVVSPPGTDLVEERREHMMLYNLIGDPTLRLHHPHPLLIVIPSGHELGESFELQIESPIEGELHVAFDRPLGSVTEGDPNETTIITISSRVLAGQRFSRSVTLPANVTGPVLVRAFVAGTESWASAAARTIVR